MKPASSKSFVFGLCSGLLLVVGVNFVDYLDWEGSYGTCLDCALPFGIPFHMYASSGFATPSGFQWKGLIANATCGMIFGLGMGWLFQQCAVAIASFRKP